MLKLYGLKNCDTCKKALKALAAAEVSVDFIDIRAEADLQTSVPQWLTAVGADTLVNRRSTTWRNLDDTARNSPPQDLLINNPTLIKRPVIESGEDIHVGWTKTVAETLGA